MRSIGTRLAVWLLATAALSAALFALIAHQRIQQELDETLDQTLRQVALAVADATVPSRRSNAAAAADSSIVVLEWGPGGRGLLYRSHEGVALQPAAVEGLARQRVGDADWDVYTVLREDRVVQAAQRAGYQQEEAAEAAARLFPPFALLGGLSALVVVVLVRRGLKPLDEAARDLSLRTADSLEPVDLGRTPREIRPLVLAVNRLMQRLAGTLAARRRFVADAAHELRTPITALKLQLELLDGAQDDDARHRARAELGAGVARAQRLVAQLLDLSRVEPERQAAPVPCSLAAVVREVVAEWAALALARGLDLGAQLDDEGRVLGEPEALRMLVGNLVGNALRFTPRGGVVDVVVEQADGCPLLRVVDTGPGIPAAERRLVFERFHRVSGHRPAHGDDSGSGLGLAIVDAVAERHGAAVSLHEGRGGAGLEVRVVFPRPSA